MEKTVTNSRGKPVGVIINGVYKKILSSSKHMLKKPEGWCIDSAHLKEDWHELRILDRDTNIVYSTNKDSFLTYGIKKNYGYGDQVCLPLKWFSRLDPAQSKLL